MYKAIIFDFFGVIYSDPANRWFQKHDIQRTGEYAEVFKKVDHGFISIDEAFEELASLSGQSKEEIKSVFGQTDMIDHEVVEIIKNLKNNYKLCLLSNASSGYLNRILNENSLGILFDEIIISSDVGMIKPNPQIFDLTLDRLGLESAETIFIDDWPGNISSAEEIGIKGIVFTGAKSLRNELNVLKIQI